MFLQYFGLQEDPFGVTPEPRYLYQSSTHREALASLKFGFHCNRGFTTLIAPPGLGKTTLLHRFLGDIGDSARSAFLFDLDSQCEPRELIASILRDLEISPSGSSNPMHEQLKGVLLEEARRGRVAVVLIDEAQNLSEAALETVRLLSNFETTRAKLIHIVLAGQPQLSDKLMQPTLLQLRQRITTVCRIHSLSAEEARAYVEHRLQLAGYGGDPLFTDDALNLIIQASQGIPRTINNLCFNGLSICRAMNQKQVSAGMVEEAVVASHLIQDPRVFPAVSIPAASGIPTHTSGFKDSIAAPAPPIEMFQYASKPERSALERPWKIAAAVLLPLLLTSVGYSGFRLFQNHDVSANTKSVTPVTPVVDVAKYDKIRGEDAASAIKPFQVKVGRHQTLRDIALRYIGEFNEAKLHEICGLNPNLTNPNHVETGQKIWLPGPPVVNVAKSAANSNDARNVP